MKRKAVSGLMLILALILVVVFSTFQMFNSQVKAEYGYTDFESGFDGWEPFTVSHVSVVQISTTYAHSGTHSVEMYDRSYGNDTIGPGGGIKLPVTSTSELYELTAWVYATERSDGHAGGLFGFRVGGEKVGWNPWASHSSYVWVRQSEGYQQKGSLSNPIPYGLTLNTWHKVGVRLDSTLGTISVLLDDTLIVDPWPAFNAGEKPTDWDIHCWANYYGNFVMHQYVDDVEVLASARKITILSPQNKTYATTSIPLTFTVNETTSWMGYSLDDEANVTISGNTTLTGLTEGPHSVVVFANDTSGNMGVSNKVFFTVELPISGLCAISVEPSKTIMGLGYTVTATVTITNITDCAGYQLWIDYESIILEMASWTFDTDPANPLSPTQVAPDPNDRVDVDQSVPGSVKVATVWSFGVPTYSGSGVAAEITFNATMLGNSTLNFDQAWTRVTDDPGNDILFQAFIDAWVFVTLPGDVDGDRDVDVGDQRKVQLAMFSIPGDPNWDPKMDIDSDLDVDVGDMRKQQLHMFESW